MTDGIVTVAERNVPGVGMTSAEKMRAKRERNRAQGLCLVCGKDWRKKGMRRCKPLPGKTVCKGCNEAAKGRVKRLRTG